MHPISRWCDLFSARRVVRRPFWPWLVALACVCAFPDFLFAETRTWKGGGGSWMSDLNWVGNVAPIAGDTLIFPNGSPGATTNDFPVDTEFASLTVAEGYTIVGNRILLADSITALPGTGTGEAWIVMNILLKVTIAGTRTITMSAGVNGRLSITGVITGGESALLRKEGPGLVTLNVANAYAGPTTIASGPLVIRSVGSLGSNINGTTVLPGGTLELALAGGSITEPLTLVGDDVQGALGRPSLYAQQNAVWSAPIVLQGVSPPLITAPQPVVLLELSGVISGPQGVGFQGPGTLTFSGPGSNTYDGLTTVWLGGMVLDKNPGAVAVPAGLVIGTPKPNLDASVTLEEHEQMLGNVGIQETGHLYLSGRNETIGALVLAGGQITTGIGELTLGGAITVLQSAQMALVAGKVSLGIDSGTINVQSTTVPAIEISAIIRSPQFQGLIKDGPGAARLSGANSYGGLTIISQGTLHVAHMSALGGSMFGTNLKPAGRLHLESSVPNEPLVADAAPASEGPTIAAVGSGQYSWGGAILIDGALSAYAYPGATLRFDGDISGVGDLRAGGAGGTVVVLNGANAYVGRTIVSTRLRLTGSHRIPDASRVELQPLGTFDLNGWEETVAAVVSSSPSQVVLGGGTLRVATAAGATDVFSGVINGAGQVIKTGAGTWVLTGVSQSGAGMNVSAGTLRVTGSIASPVTLTGGTLEGTGNVGSILGPNGTLRPGSSPGVLHSASVTLGANVSLSIAIHGPTVGTEYAQLDAAGSVNLGNAALALVVSPSFPPAGAGALVIVANDGTDPIVGTFSGLAEGATIDAGNGRRFRISYTGGSGNDVVLTAQAGSYYLSEGATGSFFDLDILIANPNAADAPVTITFLREDGGVVTEHRTVPAMQRLTLRVDEIPGVESAAVSTVVTPDTDLALVVERTMRWDQTGYGAHTEKAAGGPALTWYFAEGSQGFFSTYLLLANPGPVASTATVQYLREGAAAVTRSYPVGPASRFTVNVGTDPDLANSSFGMTVTFDQPGIAERAMYFGADPVWKGGHESAGVTAPSTTWFLAEGATGPFFETFVLLANPNNAEAQATLTFLSSAGVPVTREKTVPAHGRLTVNIEGEDPSLGNVPVSTQITSSLPVIVERAQYWPDPAPQWYEAHNSFGVTATGTKWGLAEGRAGGDEAYQTYILIANPGPTTAHVSVTFLLEGGAPVVRQFTVAPTSRFNVTTGANTDVPELANHRFGAVLTSDQPIVVERAMYSDAGGQTWATGTNATATRLP